jgi:hypothetical protein
MGHVAAPELSRDRRHELKPWGTWGPQSCPGPSGGSWSHGTHGGFGAAMSPEVGAEPTGHVAAPELP